MNRVYTVADLEKYSVNRSGQMEVIGSALYDAGTYAAAGQTELNFFQTPVGQASKTLADTNMEAAGSLPAPKKFIIEAIEVLFWSGVVPGTFGAADAADYLNDVATVAKSGYLELYIGSKYYVQEGPIGVFPALNGLSGFVALSDTTTAAADRQSMAQYANMAGRPYVLPSPYTLESNQNFRVSLKWPTAVALPSGVAGRVMVRLRGQMFRLSQ